MPHIPKNFTMAPGLRSAFVVFVVVAPPDGRLVASLGYAVKPLAHGFGCYVPDAQAALAHAYGLMVLTCGNRAIRKLENLAVGEGQHRLRLGRWRVRYDVVETLSYTTAV